MEFELDLILFKKALNFYDKWKLRNSKELLAKTVKLKDISSRLILIARALTGENIDIMPAEKEGGRKGDVFFLPASFSLLPTLAENLNFYIFRVVYLSIQSEIGFSEREENKIPTTREARRMADEISSIVLAKAEEEYPPVFDFYESIKHNFGSEEVPLFWLFGKYMINRDVIENGHKEAMEKNGFKKNTVNPTTEIQSKPVEEVEIVTVDKKAQDEWVMTHNFEKVETAEEFDGIWRGFDGDDSLGEDTEALNELNLRHLVRTDEVANSIYRAEFRDLVKIADSAESESEEQFLTYPEWDLVKRKYKPDFCKVFLKKIKGGGLDYASKCLAENSKTLSGLRRKFAQINQKRQKVKKLPDGESLDIDALTDWYADLKSGRTPSENIYFSKRKKASDLAMLFLLDLSLSTDSYADGNRVLDVEKQAIILFGEVLSEYNVDFAVCGFYSKTRNNCGYLTIKDFGESWIKGKQRIGAIEPQGYTRIGPALRHSKSLIEKHAAKNKWVVLLSDGKPNDYDKYEGKYGVADVKQALREMHERHINTYAVAIESVARYYLPQMFGQNHYNILSHPDMLVQSLTMLYRRINNG